MAKIEDIVTLINTEFQAEQFNSKRFQKGSFNGVAELVKGDDGNTEPAIIATNGDTTTLSLDDTYPFQLYHRITDIESIAVVDEDGFGDIDTIQETTSLKLVVMFDRSRIRFTKEQIITAINSSFLIELTPTELQTLDLISVSIELGKWDLDKYDNFQTEYSTDNQLSTTTNIISLDYTITTQHNKSCVTLC